MHKRKYTITLSSEENRSTVSDMNRKFRSNCTNLQSTKGFQAKTKRIGWPNGLRIRCRAYTNDCFGFLKRRRRLRELLEAKRLEELAVERSDRSFLPKAGYNVLSRMSVFVWFARRTPSNTWFFRPTQVSPFPQTASRSVWPFLLGSLVCSTDTHTYTQTQTNKHYYV